MSEFPDRLRKLREKKRLKRYVLSERCGLNSMPYGGMSWGRRSRRWMR